MTLRLRLKPFRVTSLTSLLALNSALNCRVIITKRQKRYVYRRELIVNDVTRNSNRLRFIQIPSKRHRLITLYLFLLLINIKFFVLIANRLNKEVKGSTTSRPKPLAKQENRARFLIRQYFLHPLDGFCSALQTKFRLEIELPPQGISNITTLTTF